MAATTVTPSTTDTPSKVDVKDARALLDEMIAASGRIDGRVVIERDGVVLGAFVPAKDLRGLARLDEQHARHLQVLEDFGAAFAGIPEEEIEREAAKALAEADAERAARRARGEVV